MRRSGPRPSTDRRPPRPRGVWRLGDVELDAFLRDVGTDDAPLCLTHAFGLDVPTAFEDGAPFLRTALRHMRERWPGYGDY